MTQTFAMGDSIDVTFPNGKTLRYTVKVLVGRPVHSIVGVRPHDTRTFRLDKPTWYIIARVEVDA